jgi:hypothetical protein
VTHSISAAFHDLRTHLLLGCSIINDDAHRLALNEEPTALMGVGCVGSVTREINGLDGNGVEVTTYMQLHDAEKAACAIGRIWGVVEVIHDC